MDNKNTEYTTINNRIKQLRSTLGLSGEKFGASLGISRNAVSMLERGINTVTEQVIKLICFTYNVNEVWLRTGVGDMFAIDSKISLDAILQASQIDELEAEIIRLYFSLDKDTRQKLINHFRNGLK